MAEAESPQSAFQQLADRLDALARTRLGAEGARGLKRMTAGATQEVWRFDLVENGAETPLVLRRAPGGTRVSDTAVGLEGEARLLQAAAAKGVPVPAVRHVCEPEDGIGHAFIMSFVEGETLGGRIVRQPQFEAARSFLARQCGEVIAKIHTIDPAAFPNLRQQTPRELIEQYHATYKASGWPRPVIDLAFRWLFDNCPPDPAEMKLVHGDFRNGNLMIGEDGVRADARHLGDRPAWATRWSRDLKELDLHRLRWRFGQMDKPVPAASASARTLWAGSQKRSGWRAASAATTRSGVEVYGSMRWGVMCCARW